MERLIDGNLWKTGNSYVITIPKKVVKKLKLKIGDDITTIIKKG